MGHGQNIKGATSERNHDRYIGSVYEPDPIGEMSVLSGADHWAQHRELLIGSRDYF